MKLDEMNDLIETIEFALEILIGVPTFLLAIYSTYKLRLLVTFPPTTRIVLGASTGSIALMTAIHPLLNFIPAHYYSIEKGRYIVAIVVYTLQFVCLVCTVLLDTKFMIMGYESYLAFKYRMDYEYRDGSQGWMLVGYYTGFAIFVSWLKVIYYVFGTNDPIDVRMHTAFFIEDSAIFVSFQYFIAFVALVFGMVQIYRVHRFALSLKYECRTLSESFQVKQIVTLLGIIKPLAISFTIGYIFALAFHALGVAMLLKGYERTYKNLTAAVFAVGGLYNTFAIVYLIWYLPALRQLMFRDLSSLFGCDALRRHAVNTTHNVVDRLKPEEHFKHLHELWNR